MNRQRNQHLLKIFSGPHIGAEILLKPGTYDIGRGEDCDIVLQDEMINRKHARIKITDEDISVAVLGEDPVLLEGVPILVQDNQTEVALGAYETVTLGTTHLALGKPSGDWSKIQFPSLLRKADLATVPASGAARSDDEQNQFVTQMDQWIDTLQQSVQRFATLIGFGGVAVVSGRGGSSAPSAPANTDTPFRKKLRGFLKLLGASKLVRYVRIFAAVLLGVSLGLTPAVFSFTSGKIENEPDYLLLETVESVLATPEFEGVRATSISESHVVVEGYVANEADKAKLQQALGQIGLQSTLNVRTGTQLVDSSETILNVLGFTAMNIAYEPHGELKISGYSSDMSAWQNAKETLLADIAGLEGIIDDGVQDLEARRAALEAEISKQKLSSKLALKTSKDGSLTVYGVLGPQELDVWRSTLKTFRKKYGDKPIINSKVHDTREVIEIAIKSVRIGDVPYLVTEDGVTYLQGSVLPNGYTVKAIRSDKIVLSRNSVEAVYYLGN